MTTTVDRSTAWWRDVAMKHGLRYIESSLPPDAGEDATGWSEVLASGQRDVLPALDRLPILATRSSRVLDVGCGIGRCTFALAQRFDQLVGVDINPQFVEVARQRNTHPGVSFHCLPPSGLASAPGSPYDLVFSYEVFHHLQSRVLRNSVRAIYELLVPGGQFVLQINTAGRSVVGHGSLLVRRVMHHLGIALWRNWPTDPGFYRRVHSRRKLLRLFKQTGFYVQVAECTSPRQSWFVVRKPRANETGR